MRINPKNILLALLLIGLFLPMIQRQFHFYDDQKLSGWFPPVPEPRMTLQGWLDGKLQDSLLAHANNTIGFHNDLYRLNNQYYYSVFGIAKANGVVPGKENFLYDRLHIDAYSGKDYIGNGPTMDRFRQLRDLRRIWKQKGIQFQLVLVPSKATAVPEHLPNGSPEPGIMTNYRRHKHLADSMGIPCLDFVPWYKQRKKTDPNPLYPAGGIHWSNYCATLAADSLAAFTSIQTGQALNRIHIDSLRYSDHEEGEDADIANGMNLYFPLASRPAVYPYVHADKGPKKIKMLTVGDSFFWHTFSHYAYWSYAESHFFFYFNELNILGQNQTLQKAQVDLLKEMESQDVIQIYACEANLANFGWGFIEEAWKTYFDPARRAPHVDRIKNQIRKDTNWFTLVEQKAAAFGQPVDSVLHHDALWVWENGRQ